MSKSFVFSGEESARFATFAEECITSNIGDVAAYIEGREPLTSRPISINGILSDAVKNGYIRYIQLKEDDSEIYYNIGGSNSTRSVASKQVKFILSEQQINKLLSYAEKESKYIPLLGGFIGEAKEAFLICEEAILNKSEEDTRKVINLLQHEDLEIRVEAALTIRALSSTINNSRKLRRDVERNLINFIEREDDSYACVAAIEDLGYLGDEPSKIFLGSYLESAECEQSTWAAVIALGRLPGKQDIWNPLIHASGNTSLWVQRASMLSLSRRSQDSLSSKLEPVFSNYLGQLDDDLLKRYACLGLSKFNSFSENTWASIIAILEDDKAPLATKGYAALAISAGMDKCSKENLEVISDLLKSVSGTVEVSEQDIDIVWGMEFLGEVSSLLCLPELASIYYHRLSQMFDDWRAEYYEAIEYYEQGEFEVKNDDGEAAIIHFKDALNRLEFDTKNLPEEAIATIDFRKTIISARCKLQSILSNWLEETETSKLTLLSQELQQIIRSYDLYSNKDLLLGRDRHLVKREIEQLYKITRLLNILIKAVEIEVTVRKSSDIVKSKEKIMIQLDQAIELVEIVASSFEIEQLFQLIKSLKQNLNLVRTVLKEDISDSDKIRHVKGYLSDIKKAFWVANWPFPGRACPVYGLGRAKLGLRPDGYTGNGSISNPIIFEQGEPKVLPAFIKVIDMATGGTTQLKVTISCTTEEVEYNVPVVEDEFPLPFDIESLNLRRDVAVIMTAIFESRDCVQKADEIILHIRVD